MAGGKGGGSWKVAYADFVTAMMAFFLVMWIGAQDVKTRQAVANYFIDPLGASKKPAKTGAVFESLNGGAVPEQEANPSGRGRDSYNTPTEASRPTKTVADFVFTDPVAGPHWREMATRARQAATTDPQVRANNKTVEEVATSLLARQLQDELTAGIPTSASGVYQDLLFNGISDVNWPELAEDLVRESKR